MTTLVLIVIVILVCVFCAGLIAEALRIAPKTPERLYWTPEIPLRYVDIDGNRIRYIKTRQRTQPRSVAHAPDPARYLREAGAAAR